MGDRKVSPSSYIRRTPHEVVVTRGKERRRGWPGGGEGRNEGRRVLEIGSRAVGQWVGGLAPLALIELGRCSQLYRIRILSFRSHISGVDGGDEGFPRNYERRLKRSTF